MDHIKTSEYEYMDFPFEEFNVLQSMTYPLHNKNVNIVVSASTSSGKTIVAEQMIGITAHHNHKSIFLSPLKAVTQEKYDDWFSDSHGFSEYDLSIVTGDYRLTDDRLDELNNADIILLTSEMLDSRTRRMDVEKNLWLKKVRTLVVDEAHLISVEGRGHSLEAGLMRFSRINPKCRIILLSATMDNVDELKGWLTNLNGKPTKIIKTDWRPVELGIHYQQVDYIGDYKERMLAYNLKTLQTINRFSDDKFLIFVHSKHHGRVLETLLNKSGLDCYFHCADLNHHERLKIEKSFRSGGLKYLIATSTLAWGVNLPARRVIIMGTKRGIFDTIHQIDVNQMVGRSGRYGIDDRGDAHIFMDPKDFIAEKKRLQSKNIISSELRDKGILCFHIVSEIEQGIITNIDEAIEWYDRSFAAHLNIHRLDMLRDAIKELIEYKCIEEDRGKLKCTLNGRIASWLYMIPQDISMLRFGIYKLFSLYKATGDPDVLRDKLKMAMVLSNCYKPKIEYLHSEMKSKAKVFINAMKKMGLPNLVPNDKQSSQAAVLALMASDNYSLDQKRKLLGSQLYVMKQYMEQAGIAVEMICKYNSQWKPATQDILNTMVSIREEIPGHLIELVSIRGIGTTRAQKMYSSGLKNRSQISSPKGKVLLKVLFPSSWKKIIEQI